MLPLCILCLHTGGIVPHVHSVELIAETSVVERTENAHAIVPQHPRECPRSNLACDKRDLLPAVPRLAYGALCGSSDCGAPRRWAGQAGRDMVGATRAV